MTRDICSYEWDVALSFAGEDRSVAEAVALLLKENNLRVFYDLHEEAALWGRDLYQYLCDVYRCRARFCLVFLSASYAKKAWTRHELRQAQTRALSENSEYILPLRIDDTEIPGIGPTIGYIDLRTRSTREVVGLVLAKLGHSKTTNKSDDNYLLEIHERYIDTCVKPSMSNQIATEVIEARALDADQQAEGASSTTLNDQPPVANYQPAPFECPAIKDFIEITLGPNISVKMIYIPGKRHFLGARATELELPSFYISETPITIRQWNQVCDYPRRRLDIKRKVENSDCPIVWINWHEANEFCARVNRARGIQIRLPYEAEWEVACRADTEWRSPYSFGDHISATQANFKERGSPGRPTKVKHYPPNNWGLYDMHGNVNEWCMDDWQDELQRPDEGDSLSQSKVIKGGSYFSDSQNCTSSFRSHETITRRLKDLGFRVVSQ